MAGEITGYSPSSAIDNNHRNLRNALVFQVSGLTVGGALAVCMYYYSGNEWVPYTG